MLTFLGALTAQGIAALPEDDLLDQLRADYTALAAARAEFEQLEKSASAAEQEDYAAWIRQLGEQFADSCRKLSVGSDQSIPADIPCTEFASAYTAPVQINIEMESTDSEKTAAMVGQFNESLGEFDEKLLREEDRVKAARPRTASSGSGGGGGASGESGQAGTEGEDAEEGRQSGQQGADGEAGREQTGDGARGRPSGGNPSSAPDDIPDGSDDDVIARQLREAAEKETDPELKKKLWEEYRRYKRG